MKIKVAEKLSIGGGLIIAMIVIAVAPIFAVNHAKAQVSSSAQGLAQLIAVNNTIGTSGGAFTSNTSDLANLIVLSGLFPTSTNASTNAKNLAGLIAVNNVTGGSSGGALTNNTSDLANLIVLNGLFPTSTNASTNAKNLAGLIAVNNVTGGSNGSFTSSTTNLGELLVLNGLFMDP